MTPEALEAAADNLRSTRLASAPSTFAELVLAPRLAGGHTSLAGVHTIEDRDAN